VVIVIVVVVVVEIGDTIIIALLAAFVIFHQQVVLLVDIVVIAEIGIEIDQDGAVARASACGLEDFSALALVIAVLIVTIVARAVPGNLKTAHRPSPRAAHVPAKSLANGKGGMTVPVTCGEMTVRRV